MAGDLAWRDAVIKVLKTNGKAMHYKEIAEQIAAQGLRKSLGATPASSVSYAITTDINQNPTDSTFVRTNPGEYTLRDQTGKRAATPSPTGMPVGASQVEDASEEASAVKALGMYWRREYVEWGSLPKLFGQQQIDAQPVNFSDQRGVCLLHDGTTTIYVGRATDRPLGKRLFEHTKDRLNGRWDRFSWFGFRSVGPDGKLKPDSAVSSTPAQMIYDVEAVLIEALEPPLNRRRGDGLVGAEYIQVEDEEIKKKKALHEVVDQFSRK